MAERKDILRRVCFRLEISVSLISDDAQPRLQIRNFPFRTIFLLFFHGIATQEGNKKCDESGNGRFLFHHTDTQSNDYYRIEYRAWRNGTDRPAARCYLQSDISANRIEWDHTHTHTNKNKIK